MCVLRRAEVARVRPGPVGVSGGACGVEEPGLSDVQQPFSV